jgi:hypothetical protein
MLPRGEQVHVAAWPAADPMCTDGITARERQSVTGTSGQGDLRDPLMPRFHRLPYAVAVTRLISARTGNFSSQALRNCAGSHISAHSRRSIPASR